MKYFKFDIKRLDRSDTRPPQILKALLLTGSIFVGVSTWFWSVKAIAAPLPFSSCPAPAYITQGANTSSIKLHSVDLLTGTLTAIGPNIAGGTNAIGFNRIDQYIYGIKFQTTNLHQIAADGTAIDLGPITG